MKRIHLIGRLMAVFTLLLLNSVVGAGKPVWVFTPLTATSITVPANGTATIQYQVSNQSPTKSHQLVIMPIPGVSQNAPCVVTPKGQPGDSCTLTLIITGSKVPEGGISGGVSLCQADFNGTPNPNQCYQPSQANNVSITKGTTRYTVGGTITGLTSTVTLLNNGTNSTSMSTDGSFTFSTPVAEGSTYNVTVGTQPTDQTCTVANGSGTMGGANVTNVTVTCSTNAYTVGGTLTGLIGAVTLLNNGTNSTLINTNGSFTFSTPVAQGSTYNVTVGTQPTVQTCTVANGSGTMGGANVTNVTVTCSINTYTVGGTVTGLIGTVTLLNNSTNPTLISADGSFTFSTSVAQGSIYNVTVGTQPTEQTCTVANGLGTINGANITNVAVTCVTNNTTLSVSPTGTIPIDGGSGTLTITNTGTTYTAYNVSALLPGGWTGVTQDSSNCTSIAPNNGTCTLTFTSTTPYIAQGNIIITGDNITSPPTTALAFTSSGYLIWRVSATTVDVIDTSDLSSSPQQWGGFQTAIGSGAQSTTNGAANTIAIVNALGTGSSYAAEGCNQSTNGGASIGTWFLPAYCQMGASNCAGGLANIDINLVQLGFGGLSGLYWSSTELITNPPDLAIAENFVSGGGSNTNNTLKNVSYGVRCVRSLSH